MRWIVGCAALAAAFVPLTPAQGEVFTVGTAQELQDALSGAENGDEIRILPGTYVAADVGGTFTVNDRSDLTIRGIGKVTLQGSSDGPALTIEACANIDVQGLRFAHEGSVGKGSIAVTVRNGDQVSVRKCRITGGRVGVSVLNTTGMLVEDVKIAGVEDGVATLDGSTDDLDFKVNRVKMKDISDRGVVANSRYSVIEYCKFRMLPGAEGAVRVFDLGEPIDGVIVKFNKITGGVDGVQVRGGDHETNDNKIKKTERYGVAVESGTGAFVGRNKIKRCGEAGIFVGTAGNFVQDNVSKKSGQFDILSTVPEGSNTFERNRIRTSQFGM